jgi:hypothetical protein
VARVRYYFTDEVTLEGVYVPVFRRGRFDQLDEDSSPFNVAPSIPLPVEQRDPSTRWGSAQGGVRFAATTGRFDWSMSAYRGFEPFPFARFSADASTIVSIHPRFTMIGGDFEAVRGDWGLRGEGAAFVRDNFQGTDLSVSDGHSFDTGLGVDRRAGGYQLTGTVLFHREDPAGPDSGFFSARNDLSIILSADRTFVGERYRTRAFTVYNPSEGSAFLRFIGMATLRDDLALEASGGWFPGDGRDTIGRFSDSDFVYARLRCYW